MASATAIKTGPTALTTTLTTNLHNPAATVVDYWRHAHVVNKTGAAATFSMWVGATGSNTAGTEIFNLQSVAAQGVYDFFWGGQGLKLKNADFVVGGASANTTLTHVMVLDSTILV